MGFKKTGDSKSISGPSTYDEMKKKSKSEEEKEVKVVKDKKEKK